MSVDGPPASGSEPQIQSPSLVGQILDGRYRIIRKIGEGGMGEVYAAEHVHIEKRFAIKLLRQEIVSNPEAVTRFRQEARSSSSIGHRNIIAIEDFGQLIDGRIYMCMELLNGAALNDMITQPLAVDRLLNILIQTGHGLAAAHAKNIVHRDMKPENIFVTIGPNGEDIPKILDFGIAKVAGNDGENHLTRTGTIFGTPYYMAPEQALGNPVDARTDIYAVGVIMYECFAGSLPFQGDSFMGILTQHITMDPEPVAQRAARAGRQLPNGLADVITCCMQKNPMQRFSSMDDLVNVLIQIYRGMVGPGMSTYMEAFPVLPSSAHQVQATPPPMTRPITGVYPATGPATGPVTGPSGAQPAMSAASSGVYPGTQQAPKSKVGLIIAILVVLVVGAGIAALVVLTNKKDPGTGLGSGSQIAIKDPGSADGSSHAAPGGKDGSAKDGSATRMGKDGSAGSSAVVEGSAAQHPGDGSEHAGSAAGSNEAPDPGSNSLPRPEVVLVPLFARNTSQFEVYEDGVKLLDGPDNLEVPKGEKRTVVIKARGFKDKTLVVQGVKKRLQFSLDRIAGPRPGPGPGPGPGSDAADTRPPPPPPPPNCANAIVDIKSKACVAQYCTVHPNDVSKCGLE
jgi:serine/threonine-protein kinase